MRKLLFFTGSVLLSAFLQINAQTTIFEENFESTPDNEIPTDWMVVDGDNDYVLWTVINDPSITDTFGFSGKVITIGSSLQSSNNVLNTPAINLPLGSSSLSFQIGTVILENSSIPIAEDNHYAVYVLPEGSTFTGTEIPVLEEDIIVGGVAVTKTINLSEFAGQSVKIYFRQFSDNQGIRFLMLDTVKISQEILGVSENTLASEFTIYPNPTSDYIYVRSKSKIDGVEIFDMNGRKVNAELLNDKINIQQLPSAFYLMKITTGDKTYSRKILKK